MALSTNDLHLTDEIAITYKLDICTLYKVSVEDKNNNRNFSTIRHDLKCSVQLVFFFIHMPLAFVVSLLFIGRGFSIL